MTENEMIEKKADGTILSQAEAGAILEERIAVLEAENAQLKETLNQYASSFRETMGRYLTDEVRDEILAHKDETAISGERRQVTIMFSDIRHSTELSEAMAPADFIRMLNHYLGEMIEIVNAWQGNILGFAGDGISTVFGAPKDNEEAPRDAVACAVAMQKRMDKVNEWNQAQGYPEIQMGIGIHTGDAILGTIGSQTRMKYDMIGRNVNLASRVEGFTKGGQILVTTETLNAAGDMVVSNESGAMWVKPKGIHEEILVHDIVGFGAMRLNKKPE